MAFFFKIYLFFLNQDKLEKAIELRVLEHSLQTFAHCKNSSCFRVSQSSAHSSQMPTHNRAIFPMLADCTLRAWNVFIQISAHSSRTLNTFLDTEWPALHTSVRRFSHRIHASTQAFVWLLEITIMGVFLRLLLLMASVSRISNNATTGQQAVEGTFTD